MPPKQKPHRSEQSVQTPPEFIAAVKAKFRIDSFDVDLAADGRNTKSRFWFDEAADALLHDWNLGDGWNWLNPPYQKIRPWVERAYSESKRADARTLVLVPAATGSNWWRDWVHGKAMVFLLNGRITFVGHTAGYPKDLALLSYSPLDRACINGGDWPYDIWTWTNDIPR